LDEEPTGESVIGTILDPVIVLHEEGEQLKNGQTPKPIDPTARTGHIAFRSHSTVLPQLGVESPQYQAFSRNEC
jgi:hypothetical protein